MTSTDWNDAERLWRSGAAMDEKLAMVERALAALAGKRTENENFEAARGRGAGRKK
jgi:hypothetical protein